MIRLPVLAILVACGSKGSEPTVTEQPAAPTPAGSAAPPPRAELPAGRDAEVAKLVKAGATCALDPDDRISVSCNERRAAADYASLKQQSQDVAASCAELLRDSSIAVRRVAAVCLEQLTADALTSVFGHVLDTLEAEQHETVKAQLALSIWKADASAAKVEARVLSLIDKLVQSDEEGTASNLLRTMFPLAGKQPSKLGQDYVLKALTHPKGELFQRAADLARLLEDKPAVCKALATAATPEDETLWSLALVSINQLGVVCADQVPGVIEKIIADSKWVLDRPDELTRLAEQFELTPALRKQAIVALTRAKPRAGDYKASHIDLAIAAFSKPANN